MPRTILVVDDDEKLNRLLKRFLKDYGFEVYSATDAHEGLKKCRTVLPDLIILDVMLPGKTGFEIMAELRSDDTLAEMPVLMLTARGQARDREMALQAGVSRFMTKPFSNEEMLSTVRELTAGRVS